VYKKVRPGSGKKIPQNPITCPDGQYFWLFFLILLLLNGSINRMYSGKFCDVISLIKSPGTDVWLEVDIPY
jgi:hypothetical protein